MSTRILFKVSLFVLSADPRVHRYAAIHPQSGKNIRISGGDMPSGSADTARIILPPSERESRGGSGGSRITINRTNKSLDFNLVFLYNNG